MVILLDLKFFFYYGPRLTGSDPTSKNQWLVIQRGSFYVAVLLDEFQSFIKLLSGERNQPNFAEPTGRRFILDF